MCTCHTIYSHNREMRNYSIVVRPSCMTLYIYIYIYIYTYIGLFVGVFANGLGDQGSIPSQVILKTQEMVLDTTLLKHSEL